MGILFIFLELANLLDSPENLEQPEELPPSASGHIQDSRQHQGYPIHYEHRFSRNQKVQNPDACQEPSPEGIKKPGQDQVNPSQHDEPDTPFAKFTGQLSRSLLW